MNSDITTFNFETSSVRTYLDDRGNPFFCANDVCSALGYTNSRNTLKKHCISEGVSKRYTPTAGGFQELSYIDERNLYRLTMRSKLDSALRFQDWVCGEVIPSIRKTGSYSSHSVIELPDFTNPAIAARAWAEQYEKRQLAEAQIESDKPLVEFATTLTRSDSEIYIREGAKLLGVPVRSLFNFLREIGWIFKRSSEPVAEVVKRGLMTVRPNAWTDDYGITHYSTTGMLTYKGLENLHIKLKNSGRIPFDHQLNLNLT